MTKGQSHRLRQGRYSETGRIYLITSTCHRRARLFRDYWSGRCVVQAMRATEKEALTLSYVVMPDHIHWLMQLREGAHLSTSVQKMKSLTTRQLRATGLDISKPVWADGFHDRALRQEEDIRAAARYIVANPLRAGLVKSLKDYPLWDAIWL